MLRQGSCICGSWEETRWISDCCADGSWGSSELEAVWAIWQADSATSDIPGEWHKLWMVGRWQNQGAKSIDQLLGGTVQDLDRISGKTFFCIFSGTQSFAIPSVLLQVSGHGPPTTGLQQDSCLFQMRKIWSYLHGVSRHCSVIGSTGSSVSCRSRWGKPLRGGAEGHLATPMNVNICPSCSIADVDSCAGSHQCTHNACENKVHVNGSDDFVNMSENKFQRSLSLDGLVHCDLVHDDIVDDNDWSSTVAESDGMVHAEKRASDVREMGAVTTGAHAVKRPSESIIECGAWTTVAHAEKRMSCDIMQNGASGYVHAEVRVHRMGLDTEESASPEPQRILSIVWGHPWEWRTWWNLHRQRSGCLVQRSWKSGQMWLHKLMLMI